MAFAEVVQTIQGSWWLKVDGHPIIAEGDRNVEASRGGPQGEKPILHNMASLNGLAGVLNSAHARDNNLNEFVKGVQDLSAGETDVIVVRMEGLSAEQAELAAHALQELPGKWLLITNGASVEVVPEEIMSKLGWVRK